MGGFPGCCEFNEDFDAVSQSGRLSGTSQDDVGHMYRGP